MNDSDIKKQTTHFPLIYHGNQTTITLRCCTLVLQNSNPINFSQLKNCLGTDIPIHIYIECY